DSERGKDRSALSLRSPGRLEQLPPLRVIDAVDQFAAVHSQRQTVLVAHLAGVLDLELPVLVPVAPIRAIFQPFRTGPPIALPNPHFGGSKHAFSGLTS